MNYQEMEMRAVYAETLNELMETNPAVMCLEADLGKASGTVPKVSDKNPDNFVECGVAEANMICVPTPCSACTSRLRPASDSPCHGGAAT